MRTLLQVFALGIAASVLALSLPVHADGAKDKAEAKAAFRKGTKLYDSEKYVEAVKVFRKAYQLSPHWKLLYNIGQCEAASRNYGLALEAFESYLVDGGDDVPASRQDDVRKEMSRLRDLCGDVEIDAPSGSVVFIDDTERGRTPISGGLSVGAGTHALKVVREGKVLLQQEIRVRGAKTLKITVDGKASASATPKTGPTKPVSDPESDDETDPESEPESTEMPEPTDDTPPNKMLIIGSVLTAVGGATAIAGAVTGGLSRSKTKDLEKACPDKQCSDSDSESLHDEAANLSLATDVMIPAGAVIAVAGVVLVVIGLKKETAEEPDTGLSVSAGAGHFGAVFTGRF